VQASLSDQRTRQHRHQHETIRQHQQSPLQGEGCESRNSDNDKQREKARRLPEGAALIRTVERPVEPVDQAAEPDDRMTHGAQQALRIACRCFNEQGQ